MNLLAILDVAPHYFPLMGSPSATATLGTITHLGDARAIVILGLAMAIVLWRRGNHSYWLGLGVSVFGALASSWLIKVAVARPRPLDALIDVGGYSLPSMHAAVGAALYGYLMYVTLRLMHPPHHRIAYAALLFATLLLIGISRVYLHVHYASDVLAGFVLGGLWIAVGIFVEKRSRAIQRGR